MGLSPSSEAASSAATQKFPNVFWNPKVHYRTEGPSIGSYPEPGVVLHFGDRAWG
jgi:hypothetical protein